MMVSEKETASIRRFVCGQLRDEHDLSKLTIRILRRRYLAHAQCEALSPEARRFMKEVVQEELMKMQDIDKNGSEFKTKGVQNKRKREKENNELIKRVEDESIAKKSRCQSRSSSESMDKEDYKTTHSDSEEEEQIKSGSENEEKEMNKSQKKANEKRKNQINSEGSTDEERNESEKEGKRRNCSSSPKEKVKNEAKNGEKGSSNKSQGNKTPKCAEESESDTDDRSGSDKIKGSDSSDDSDKEKASVEKKNNDPDSDSSSLPSLEDEQDGEKENLQDDKNKKTEKKEKRAKAQKEENKAVVRLKRYISLCGVRRNYKKLLDGCRSVSSQVAVLKKELEDLGVHGQPSIEKCKKARMKRENAQELAELDVSNIITTQGRPTRRGASAWREQQETPSSAYVRTLSSGSDSDQDIDTHKRRKRATDWDNLQGIISDDANSD